MKYDKLCIAAIRSLCIDGINKAKSGHPGMALGSAPILYTLYTRHLVADPSHPNWINRDRFVLSAGHASMLLYTMLHLSGYAVSMDDLKNFRQLGSKTPGHPEVGHTSGVDATSGPLGQGIAQAVGIALAETSLSHIYPEGEKIFNHYTYCLCGDGCLQEGLSQEAISFAGTQHLNKLILFYDSNNITLDGPLSNSNNEDQATRFKAAGWNVLLVKDGNDVEAIDEAIIKAKTSSSKPTLIIVNTIIGYGSAKQGQNSVHGSPLGLEDGERAKSIYGYNYPPFTVPDEVYLTFKESFKKRGAAAYSQYEEVFNSYRNAHLDEANYLTSTANNNISSYVFKELPKYPEDFKDSTRNESGALLKVLNKEIKNLIGGSADVAHSVMTMLPDEKDYSPEHRDGRNINFGIREFAMACIQNGILLHGGLRTYAGCFLVFADYLKPAIRLAALSKLPSIYLFSHDSIAVGEDGPTHQPIEQLAMLRSIPNSNVLRPADAREVAASWKIALDSTKTPTSIILSRQSLPAIKNTSLEGVMSGGYVVSKENENLDFTIIASGSEVSLAIEAQKLLWSRGIDTRVVSMPSTYLFDKQNFRYQEETLGKQYDKRIAVEMLSGFGWHKYAKNVFDIDTFGASGPAGDVQKHFNYTPESLALRIASILGK